MACCTLRLWSAATAAALAVALLLVGEAGAWCEVEDFAWAIVPANTLEVGDFLHVPSGTSDTNTDPDPCPSGVWVDGYFYETLIVERCGYQEGTVITIWGYWTSGPGDLHAGEWVVDQIHTEGSVHDCVKLCPCIPLEGPEG